MAIEGFVQTTAQLAKPNKGENFPATSTNAYVAHTPAVTGVKEWWVHNQGVYVILIDFKRNDDTTETLDWEVAAGAKAFLERDAKAILIKSKTAGQHSLYNIVSQSYE